MFNAELPSETLNKLKEKVSESTIRNRNLKWFANFYYERYKTEYLPETNPNPTKFIVGKCYTFFYFNPKYKDTLDFWNAVPVGIFLGYLENGNPMFLALHFIPPEQRLFILDKITKVNYSKINTSLKEIKRNGKSFQELDTRYNDLEVIIKNSGFKFAIRSYIMSRINKQPLVISHLDWWRVATFPTRYINKKDIRAVYILYKRAMGIDPFKKKEK